MPIVTQLVIRKAFVCRKWEENSKNKETNSIKMQYLCDSLTEYALLALFLYKMAQLHCGNNVGLVSGDREFNPSRCTVKCDLGQVVHTHCLCHQAV